MPALLSDPVTDAVAAVGKLRADDRLVTDSAMLLGDVEALADAITVLGSVLVDRLAEARRVEATDEHYGRSPKRWLVADLVMAGPEASRYVSLASHLQQFAATRDALASARISLAHAHAIVKGLRSLPAEYRPTVEPHLVERAFDHPPEEIAGFIDELLEALGIDKESDVRRERRYAERGFDVTPTMDRHRNVGGTLTPDVSEKLEKALQLASQRSGDEDDRTLRQRQHDALGTIADAYLATAGTPNFNGAPRAVIITMDLETLENQLREQWLTLPSGAQISAQTARRLACEAALIPAVLGGDSEVLDIGKAGHEFTVATRRAAWLRDGGRCAFPSCRGKPAELHHIKFRRHGGPGCLDNAAWLCTYHHWLVHEGGWTLQRDPADNSYLWTGPHGQQRIRKLGTARQSWTA